MIVEEFALTVHKEMKHLKEFGYQLEGTKTRVSFVKHLNTDIECEIVFDLVEEMSMPYLPYWQYDVELFRRRRTKVSQLDKFYRPLAIDLGNLLQSYYALDLSDSKLKSLKWTFGEKEELEKQLEIVQSLLLEYGVPWLEDRTSDIDWVKSK